MCPGISKGRDKVIRIIKIHKGGKYLLDNYEWLGYHKEHIRNHKGKRSYDTERKKSEMLFKPSLATRKPSDEEYKKWTDGLTEINNILVSLDSEIKDTTEGRYLWKIKELKKRTMELCSLIKERSGEHIECIIEPTKKPKPNPVELHRNVFEKAKEQIDLVGRVNVKKIAEELDVSTSNVRRHLKKLNSELEALIKKWQDRRDVQMTNIDTRTTVDDSMQQI